jgi:hypothetical protein
MATWVSHFRIAEAVLDQGLSVHRQWFVAGNVAPDSGVLNDERTAYLPDTIATHWRNPETKQMEPERFYEEMFPVDDPVERAFKLGYYCHILADVVWTEVIWRPKRASQQYREKLDQDPAYIWEIKQDWYGLDFLHLRENPDSLFFKDYATIDSIPDFIDIFPPGAFTQKLHYIQQLYLNPPDFEIERPYVYLNMTEIDNYVARAIEVTLEQLRVKGFLEQNVG